MRRSLRVAALAVLLIPALAGTTGRAQDQAPAPAPAPAQIPTFRTGINFVSVDAIVTDKSGNPVLDLKPEDFVVTEQSRPQKIETFKMVSLDGGLIPGPDGPPRAIISDLDEEREAARADVRLFSIFLDDYHVTLGSSLTARDQIARFVDTQLGPSDMVGVMYPLQSISSVRMTRNHGAVMGALQQFDGRKYDYRPRNSIEERYQYYPAETIERIRNQVSLSAIEGLIVHMGGLKEGRKALILVSEGFTNILPQQMRDPNASYPGLLNPASRDPLAGVGSLAEDRAAAMATWDMDLELRQLATAANRYNVAIYAVDPRGLAGSEFDIQRNIGGQVDRQFLNATMESLRTLTTLTDGGAIMNRNDLTMGMKQIVRDSSAYYLLGYNSTFTDTDGKFHEIKVSVKRPGVQVRARKGYWAVTRQEAAVAAAPPKPALPKPIENALSAAAVTSRSRAIRTWIGTERGEDGKTKVTFVWEPTPRLPGEPVRESDQPARVTLMAAGADGDPYFRGQLAAGPAAAGAPGESAAGRRVSFDAPPGAMQLRVSVEGAGSELLDSETREVAVPDLTAPRTLLSTPQIHRARTVREMQQLKADARPLPAIGRDFSRTDRLLIRVAAYGPGTAAPRVSAKLLSRVGQVMTEFASTPSSGGAFSDVEIPLSGLAAGEYIIQVDATGEGGDAQELVAFRVTG